MQPLHHEVLMRPLHHVLLMHPMYCEVLTQHWLPYWLVNGDLPPPAQP